MYHMYRNSFLFTISEKRKKSQLVPFDDIKTDILLKYARFEIADFVWYRIKALYIPAKKTIHIAYYTTIISNTLMVF